MLLGKKNKMNEKPIKIIESFNIYNNYKDVLKELEKYDLRDKDDNNILVKSEIILSDTAFLEISKFVNMNHINKHGKLSILEGYDINSFLVEMELLEKTNFNFLYKNPNNEYPFVEKFIEKYIKYSNDKMFSYNEKNFLCLLSKIDSDDQLFREKYLNDFGVLFNTTHDLNIKLKKELLRLGYVVKNYKKSPYSFITSLEAFNLLLENNVDINFIDSDGMNVLASYCETQNYNADKDIVNMMLDHIDSKIINKFDNKGNSFIYYYCVKFSHYHELIINHNSVNCKLLENQILNNFSINSIINFISEGKINFNEDNFNEIGIIKQRAANRGYYEILSKEVFDLFHKHAPKNFSTFLNNHFFDNEFIYKYYNEFKRRYELLTLDEKDKITLLNKNINEKLNPRLANYIGKQNYQYDQGRTFINLYTDSIENYQSYHTLFNQTNLSIMIKHVSTDILKEKKEILFDHFLKNKKYLSNTIIKNIINKDIEYFNDFFMKEENYRKYILNNSNIDHENHDFIFLLDLNNPLENMTSLKINNSLMEKINLQEFNISTLTKGICLYLKKNNLNIEWLDNFSSNFLEFSSYHNRYDLFKHIKMIDNNKINDTTFGLTLCDYLMMGINKNILKTFEIKGKKNSFLTTWNNALNQLINKGYNFNNNEVKIFKNLHELSSANKSLIERILLEKEMEKLDKIAVNNSNKFKKIISI